MNKYLVIGIVAILIIAGGWWYFNQAGAPTTSETAQLPTGQTTQLGTDGWQTKTVSDLHISFQMPQDWVYLRGATANPYLGDEFSIGTKKDEETLGRDGNLIVVQVTTSTATTSSLCINIASACTDETFTRLRALPNGGAVIPTRTQIDQGGSTIQVPAVSKTGNTIVDGYPAVTVEGLTWIRAAGKNWFISGPNSAAYSKFLASLTLH